jgi:hypothetical protein
MNPNGSGSEEANQEERLTSALRKWVVDAPLPPRFQEAVWQRIARAETPTPAAAGSGLRRWLELLPRPKFAFAYLAVLLAAGLAAGSWAAQARASHVASDLSSRYVQAIDPFRVELPEP